MEPSPKHLFPAGKSPSSGRRTPSSSSFSSSSSSYFLDSSPLSPATPLRIISTVPFSWEKLPGVPKKQTDNKFSDNDHSLNPLLPLPPSKRQVIRENGNKNKAVKNQREDPFFVALVECSRQDRESGDNNVWSNNKVSRALSDRFGFVSLYNSCKNTCAVSESIVYLPRSSRTGFNYDRIDRRCRQNYYHR